MRDRDNIPEPEGLIQDTFSTREDYLVGGEDKIILTREEGVVKASWASHVGGTPKEVWVNHETLDREDGVWVPPSQEEMEHIKLRIFLEEEGLQAEGFKGPIAFKSIDSFDNFRLGRLRKRENEHAQLPNSPYPGWDWDDQDIKTEEGADSFGLYLVDMKRPKFAFDPFWRENMPKEGEDRRRTPEWVKWVYGGQTHFEFMGKMHVMNEEGLWNLILRREMEFRGQYTKASGEVKALVKANAYDLREWVKNQLIRLLQIGKTEDQTLGVKIQDPREYRVQRVFNPGSKDVFFVKGRWHSYEVWLKRGEIGRSIQWIRIPRLGGWLIERIWDKIHDWYAPVVKKDQLEEQLFKIWGYTPSQYEVRGLVHNLMKNDYFIR